MYCGKEITEMESNNPDDYIHRIVSKFSNAEDKDYCCKYCNKITRINRELARIITEPEHTALALLQIQFIIEEMSNKEDDIARYYAERIACKDNKYSFAKQTLEDDNFTKFIINKYSENKGK